MNFNKVAFNTAFDAAIIELSGAEKITKAVLLTLSRSVLEALQVTEDIGYVNRLVAVLTPVNKKVATLFFAEFSGFKLGKDGVFTTKDKKNYDEVVSKALVFLEDVNNNIWSWAAREVEIEKKEFDVERMKKQVAALLKKVEDNKMDQALVLKAMLENGLKLETLVALLDTIETK